MFATENEGQAWLEDSKLEAADPRPNKTRFQLILPVGSQNVTKNRTDHRMHVDGPQICQINRWNNSVQNVYGMNRQQLTVWPGKLIFL